VNKTTTIGIDLAKTVFALVALGPTGPELWRKTLSRHQVLPFLATQAKAQIALEACGSAHYWARQIRALGHAVVLLPPQHVKGYLRGQKNDYNDARAIAEALYHGAIRPVPIKSVEQQDDQALLGIRRGLSRDRTRLANQLRGQLAEYGLVAPHGVASLRKALPVILDDRANGLTERYRHLLRRQYERLLALDGELGWYDEQLQVWVRDDEVCQRLCEIPGIGAVNACALKSWLGDGRQFGCGRAASAALGLIPRQYGTGGKVVLSRITKRGDGQLRAWVVHGARAVVSRAAGKSDRLSCWIEEIKARRGFNKAVVALANKLVRLAWVIVARGERYRPAQVAMV